MPRRPGRAAARRAVAKLESTPKTFDEVEDEAMPDASSAAEADTAAAADADADAAPAADAEASDAEQTKPDDANDNEDDEASGADGEAQEKEEDQDQNPDENQNSKSPTPEPQPVVRRRRLGRPPKNRPPDWDSLPIESPQRDPNDTPKRRGRGGWRGRGGRKGASYAPTQQAIDKEGTMADIGEDELILPEDPVGETKVDKMGRLQGDRDYRCRTFTIAGRGERLYMLSTEPARCVGFRDSYLFFTKHRRLYKILIDDEEKRDLIERELIPHSYKGRSIGIVTARSVFREFGALIVVGGRKVIDDYDMEKARAEGAVEGELADPHDRYVVGEEYNKNQYVAWHGASAVYHSNQPNAPVPSGKVETKKQRRVNVTDMNWQFEHAREASRFNAEIGAVRRLHQNGIYDVHTNQMQYPAALQPTRVRIEQVQDSTRASDSARFPHLDSRVARNFKVIDTHMETPPAGISPAVYERHETPEFLQPFHGLGAVSDDIRDLLPPECRKAFDEARQNESDWEVKWGTESEATHRRQPIIDASVVPYSKRVEV